ncbi:uncharacterized protein LOC133371451 [Rhineura floridana]|uniref:uncharacterized protein LOC133371451 n=1 Tax=Rhineura floridana TaxID=261503 RepID=UPI002AC86B29|nr:uncharacterized protein LOC133371451 [Rhineura floridana]
MKGALLCVLVLLMAIGGGASRQTEGEKLCRNWLYGSEPPSVGAFQCVEERDGVACCCSSGEAPIGEQRRPTGRRLQAILKGDGEFKQSSSSAPDLWNSFWVFSAAILGFMACHWMYYCYTQYRSGETPDSDEQQIYLEDYFPTRRSVVDFFHRCGACLRRALPSSSPEGSQDTCDISPAQRSEPAVHFHHGSSGDEAIVLPPASSPVGTTTGHISQPSLENRS